MGNHQSPHAAARPLVDYALGEARAGVRVLPLRPRSKVPRLKGWPKEATTDEDTIRTWWAEDPDSNFGIITGKDSGIVVLDVDPQSGGQKSLQDLEKTLGPLPGTHTTRTGGGGTHYRFRHPGGEICSRLGLAPGVDFLADGGRFAVGPGSIHPSGARYEVIEDTEVAEAPGWLIDLAKQGKRTQRLSLTANEQEEFRALWESLGIELQAGDRLYRCAFHPDEEPSLHIDSSRGMYHCFGCDAGGGLVELRRFAKRTQRSRGSSGSATTRLVDLAGDADLFHDSGRAYASFLVDGHRETSPVKSKAFSALLRRRLFEATGAAASSQALGDALSHLEGTALYERPSVPIGVRVAGDEEEIWIDLGDEDWQAVRVDARGWSIVPHPTHTRFARSNSMLPLPMPQPGGSLDRLPLFVNIASDSDLRLLIVWLLFTFRPQGPYPIASITGFQGSAKSTTTEVLRRLVDPSFPMLQAPPRNEDDLFITATGSHLLALENVSVLQDWASDALCRLATGAGLRKRRLYTDQEEVVLDACRPIIMNGIADVIWRGDLADRTIAFELPPLTRTEAEGRFWPRFQREAPELLGVLLDALVGVLRELARVSAPSGFRLADFAHWGVAAERALGWPQGSFESAYIANRERLGRLLVDQEPVAQSLLDLMSERDLWHGKTNELLRELRRLWLDPPPRDWPSSARALTNRLRRLRPMMEREGLLIDWVETAHHQRDVVITKVSASPTSVQEVRASATSRP